MVQTPHQRKANEKFAKRHEKSMGKPDNVVQRKEKSKAKPKVSPMWLMLLLFAVVGGLVFELGRMILAKFI